MKVFTFRCSDIHEGLLVSNHPKYKQVVKFGNTEKPLNISLDKDSCPEIEGDVITEAVIRSIKVGTSDRRFKLLSMSLRPSKNFLIRLNTASEKVSGKWTTHSGNPRTWVESIGYSGKRPYVDDLLELRPGDGVIVNNEFLVLNKDGGPVVKKYETKIQKTEEVETEKEIIEVK